MNGTHPIYGLLTQMSNVTERMHAIEQNVNKHLEKLDEATGAEDATKAIEHARVEQVVANTIDIVQGNTASVYTQLAAHQHLSDACEWQFRKSLASVLADKVYDSDRSRYLMILNSMSMYGVRKVMKMKVQNNIQAPTVFSISSRIKLSGKLAMISGPADFYRQCRGKFRVTRSHDTFTNSCDKPRWKINSSIGTNFTQFDPKLLAMKHQTLGPFKADDPRLSVYKERIPSVGSFYPILEQKRSWIKQPLLIVSSSVSFENIHFSGQLFVTRPTLNTLKKKLDNIAITFINCSFGPIKRIPSTSFWDRLVARIRARLQNTVTANKRIIEKQMSAIMSIREHASGKYGSFLNVSHAQVHVFGGAVVIFKNCHFGQNAGPGIVAESRSDVIVDGCVFRGHGVSYLARSSVELPSTAAVVCRGHATLLVQHSLFFCCHCGIASFGEIFCSGNKTMTGKDYLIGTFSSELKFNTLAPFHQEFMECYYQNPDGIKELLIGASLVADETLSDCKMKMISQCLFEFCSIGIASYGDYIHPFTVADCKIISSNLELSSSTIAAAAAANLDVQLLQGGKNQENKRLISIVTGVQGLGSSMHLSRIVFSDPEKSCMAFYECRIDVRDCYCVSAKLYNEDMIDSDLLTYSNFSSLRGKIESFVLTDKNTPMPISILRVLVTRIKMARKLDSLKTATLFKHLRYSDGSGTLGSRRSAFRSTTMGIFVAQTTGIISNVLLATESIWHGIHIDNSAILITNMGLSNCNDGIFAQESEVFVNHAMISHQRRSACVVHGTTLYIDGQTNIIGAGRMAIGAFRSDVYIKNSLLRDSVTGIRLTDSSSLIASALAIFLMERGIVISATSAHAIKDVVFTDTAIEVSVV